MIKHLLLNGEWIETSTRLEVYNKYDGSLIGAVSAADAKLVGDAVSIARRTADEKQSSPQDRFQWLSKAASLLKERAEEMAAIIAAEAGKPIRLAKGEVSRAIETLTVSAEEAKRITGEEVPVAAAPNAANRLAFTMRLPLGVVCAITPFNYPLNLSCHKIGPALAAGNAIVWKPSPKTPITAMLLAEIIMAAGVPAGFLNVVVGSNEEVGETLLRDPRIDFYTFTGSLAVGEHIHQTIGARRLSMELGSNCGVIVHHDADLNQALEACISGGFDYSGQNCDHVQRIYVHENVYQEFRDQFVSRASSLRSGDPLDPDVEIGPMITETAAVQTYDRVHSAVLSGGTLLTGGNRIGAMFEPTVLENVALTHPVASEEMFAPVVTLYPYTDVEAALEQLNQTKYGLQAGVFTRDLDVAWKVAREARVGGVMINESSCYRVDLMPFGGSKMSGIGKEGPRYAIHEMTEERLVLFKL